MATRSTASRAFFLAKAASLTFFSASFLATVTAFAIDDDAIFAAHKTMAADLSSILLGDEDDMSFIRVMEEEGEQRRQR